MRTAAVVIPARLSSRRFPRKVLARETGKFLVEHVWERVRAFSGLVPGGRVEKGGQAPGAGVEVTRVLIATDSNEVEEAARSFGAEVAMTSPDHISGTDRVAEVAATLGVDFVINVQGDEPCIDHGDLGQLLGLLAGADARPATVMATLAVRRSDEKGFVDPNVVKIVLGAYGQALYFSRAPVPALPRGERPASPGGGAHGSLEWWQHVGIYAYRREFLLEFARLEPTALEKRERLEQLRALEYGYEIRVGEARGRHLGIDTEEEYQRFVAGWRSGGCQALRTVVPE